MSARLDTYLAQAAGAPDPGPAADAHRPTAGERPRPRASPRRRASSTRRRCSCGCPGSPSRGSPGRRGHRPAALARPVGAGGAHLARDFALTEQGDLVTGADSRLEALRGFEEVGDRWGLVMSLLPVGRDHSLRGEYPGPSRPSNGSWPSAPNSAPRTTSTSARSGWPANAGAAATWRAPSAICTPRTARPASGASCAWRPTSWWAWPMCTAGPVTWHSPTPRSTGSKH
ncbi:hypothetical protein ACFQ60_26970 [Streptomyces zhihengii]